jgi:radical SAM superfamily enzyme YgiQ (UPF0313 family)
MGILQSARRKFHDMSEALMDDAAARKSVPADPAAYNGFEVESGTWQKIRSHVRSRYPQLWSRLRDYKHLIRDMRDDWRQGGFYGVARPLKRAALDVRLPRLRKSRHVWLDLGDFGELIDYDESCFQDHGVGLLRTILHRGGVYTDLASTRTVRNWDAVRRRLIGYDSLIMNVRSYTFPIAVKAARIYKEQNPTGLVIVGGMHAVVSPKQMEEVDFFDKICTGPGEKVIVDLISNPQAYPRVFRSEGAKSLAEWPTIDRTLWPKPASFRLRYKCNWPLEAGQGWGPRPVASIMTSRVCPWQCSFCNENSYIPNMGRRPVEMVIDELNDLDEHFGIGSVVIHDSMFFQNPSWLKEWLVTYPKRARKLWPYWAAGRADTVCQWPDLFERLVRETNWNTVSIGFESGSDPVLRILNKQVTERENDFAINLVNRIGDEQEAAGEAPVKLWSNVMLAIPGEKPEDAIKTVRMLKRMKRATPSLAFYAPYPGSALGHQLIAEGKNLIIGNHERNPRDEKVAGIDYNFYRELFDGKFDDWIKEGLDPEDRKREIELPGGARLSDLLQKA